MTELTIPTVLIIRAYRGQPDKYAKIEPVDNPRKVISMSGFPEKVTFKYRTEVNVEISEGNNKICNVFEITKLEETEDKRLTEKELMKK